ncbi:protein kinase [candidate division KSB1 bacterium]|nr:protein kinase [candidate division KSB1 bacterium]
MIGTTISHYKIIEKLGEGGMGVVYKAEDTKLKRTVALKFLSLHIPEHETERSRFKIEAQAVAALNHPNITTIHAIEEIDHELYIVLEYIEGRELKEIISSNVANLLNISDVIDYAIHIAEGLNAAHKKGIVHRDIKSSNIMISNEGLVKIMDFGLAKIGAGVDLTKEHSTLGTTAYMSPEQIEGKEVDARTDIFSFGVVLYEMLTGHLPFRGEYEAAIIYSILNEEPEQISGHRSDVPAEIVHVLNRALEKRPENRYQSMNDLLIDLRRCKSDTNNVEGIPNVGAEKRVHQRKRPMKNRRKRMILAGVATLFPLAIALAIIFRSQLSRHHYQFNPGQATIKPLTRYEGYVIFPNLNPDGSQVAFSWLRGIDDVQGDFDIYIKLIGTESYRALTKGPGSKISPAWSSDGRYIAYLCKNGPTMDVMLIPVLGGPERKVCELDQKGIYFYADDDQREKGLWHKDFQTNLLKLIVKDEGSQPTVSPDGRTILYVNREYIRNVNLDIIENMW